MITLKNEKGIRMYPYVTRALLVFVCNGMYLCVTRMLPLYLCGCFSQDLTFCDRRSSLKRPHVTVGIPRFALLWQKGTLERLPTN